MSTTRQLHQLVHTLSYGDAISGEVLALQRCFRQLGFESEIFSINTHPKYKGLAKDFNDFPANFKGEVLLHYSLGSPLNQLYRSLNSAMRGLIHHNLTPAHWFYSINPRIVSDIERGLDELPGLCKVSNYLLADSNYNAGEIRALGFDAQVLELPIDADKWNVPANPGIQALLKNDHSLHVLHVGRLAPNKCIEDIIKSFYFLQKYVHKRSKLWLIGIDIDTEVYSFGLKRLTHELGLDEFVTFAGQRDDGELRAFYENSSVYLCMSEHEGFCLPVVEAMSFKLPVIAFASTALPDTVSTGGILVSQKKHPEIAELMAVLHTDKALRDKVVQAGLERVKSLSFDRFAVAVEQVFVESRRVQTIQAVVS